MAQTFDLEAAYRFLLRNYDPSLQLVRESPVVAPYTYWHHNDNYLVTLVFKRVSSLLPIAEKIMERIEESKKSRMVVLDGESFQVGIPIRQRTVEELSDKIILTEEPQSDSSESTGLLDPADYADIAALQAIASFNQGDLWSAQDQLFTALRRFYNGKGIKDFASKYYNIYKQALFLIAMNFLSINHPARTILEGLLAKAQSSASSSVLTKGGVITDFNGSSYVGDANTETTCLAILATINR